MFVVVEVVVLSSVVVVGIGLVVGSFCCSCRSSLEVSSSVVVEVVVVVGSSVVVVEVVVVVGSSVVVVEVVVVVGSSVVVVEVVVVVGLFCCRL